MQKNLPTGGWSILVQRYVPWALLFIGLIMIPLSYYTGLITIGTVNMLGRYMAFAIVAVGLDLIWGFTGILSLCQSFFFALGGYAMGMYLAHHGGPEGIIDANNWKIPACLYVVYPYKVGEATGDALVPWFWKPFYTLPITTILGLLIPRFSRFGDRLCRFSKSCSRSLLRHSNTGNYGRRVVGFLHEQYEAVRYERIDPVRSNRGVQVSKP